MHLILLLRGLNKLLLKKTQEFTTKSIKLLTVINNGLPFLGFLFELCDARVNTCRDGLKHTPMHFAAKEGHAGHVSVLLDAGADIDSLSTLKVFNNNNLPVFLLYFYFTCRLFQATHFNLN